MHFITYILKRKERKTIVVLKHTLKWLCFTLTNLWVVFSLSTLFLKLNFLCECSDDFLFLDANASWYMLKLKKRNSQKRFSFPIPLLFHFRSNSHTSKMLLHFHHEVEEASTQCRYLPKRGGKRDYMGRGPIWGINSMSFILSWQKIKSCEMEQEILSVQDWPISPTQLVNGAV